MSYGEKFIKEEIDGLLERLRQSSEWAGIFQERSKTAEDGDYREAYYTEAMNYKGASSFTVGAIQELVIYLADLAAGRETDREAIFETVRFLDKYEKEFF